MAIVQAVTTSFRAQLLEGCHDFRTIGGDTFKIALYSSSASLSEATTAYTATGEITGSGYTAGGAELTNVTPTSSGVIAYASFSTVTWSGELTANGALIYNTTPTHTYTNPSVMVLSFGIDRTSVGGVFTVTMPAFQPGSALIRIGQ